MQEALAAHSIDFVICSPPYPNEKDYTWTTRLETVLLDYALTRGDAGPSKSPAASLAEECTQATGQHSDHGEDSGGVADARQHRAYKVHAGVRRVTA